MKRIIFTLLAATAWSLIFNTALGADLYVATNGNNSTWTNWSTAYTNIQDALNAVTNDDTIYLAGHTFALTNQLTWANNTNVTITGGYEATNDLGLPGPYDAARWPTVITLASGIKSRILSITNVTTGTLGRVTLTGGYITNGHGGGLYVANGVGITLAQCAIVSNTIYYRPYYGCGGGLYAGSSSIVLSNCQVKWNQALNVEWNDSAYGGGIYFAGGGVQQVQDTVIANNTVGVTAGGSGGGLYGAGTVILRNNLIYGNSIPIGKGGGVFGAASSTTTVANCTIAYNVGHGVYGAGSSMAVTNSILYGNVDDVTGAVTLVYSDIGDGDSNGVNGNTNANPLFEYGYYLATNSSCHDRGTNSADSWGLTNYTTRSDGTKDSNPNVDLGYHYPAGFDLTYADIYVATNGSDSANSGTNWDQAFRSIGKAVAVMRDGTRVHVGAGQFTNGVETFPLRVTDCTGWQLQGSNRALTVIDAQSSNRVFTLTYNSGKVRMADVTIKGGVTNNPGGITGGGGLYIYKCGDLTLANCVITSNKAYCSGNYSPQGGAIYSEYSGLTISNCSVVSNWTYSGNAAANRGGGIYVTGNSYLRLQNTILAYNTMITNPKYGGGLVCGEYAGDHDKRLDFRQ